VPIINERNEEDMSYGSGTSYATPHVASAAMLWLAKNKKGIEAMYTQPWQRVEAFRYCLQVSARASRELRKDQFGAGILQVDGLMKVALPKPSSLRHAYTGQPGTDSAIAAAVRPFESFSTTKMPLAMRELLYKDWLNLVGNVASKEEAGKTALTESFVSNATRLSAGALAFGKLVAGERGRTTPRMPAQESMPGNELLSAYERLQEIHKLNASAKPVYESDEQVALVAGSGEMTVPTPPRPADLASMDVGAPLSKEAESPTEAPQIAGAYKEKESSNA
jgi:hypothetical protein